MNIETAKLQKLCKRTGLDNHGDAMTMYSVARRGFDMFAAMDAPLLPAHPIDALQVRLVRWQAHNFGTPRPVEIACGITEEVGERQLAIEQMDGPGADDAIGDIMVYACQLATAHRIAFAACLACGLAPSDVVEQIYPTGMIPLSFFGDSMLRTSGRELLTIATGYLSHVQLKNAQAIRGMDETELCRFGTFVGICMIVRALQVLSRGSIVTTWTNVAETVLKRDWKSDKQAGGQS